MEDQTAEENTLPQYYLAVMSAASGAAAVMSAAMPAVVMLMVVVVAVCMLMGMGHAVMGMFMAVSVGMVVVMGMTGQMVVMDVHKQASFLKFFLYYTDTAPFCQNISFLCNISGRGLRI